MILLDTNALLWLDRGHPRSRPLERFADRLHVSPVSLLEAQLLVETGKKPLRRGRTVAAILNDPRWLVDDPPSAALFEQALDIPWARDPFDRLLVAHARLRRWRLASSDAALLDHLDAREKLEL